MKSYFHFPCLIFCKCNRIGHTWKVWDWGRYSQSGIERPGNEIFVGNNKKINSWPDCSYSAFISEVDTKTYISIYLISLISYPFLPYDIILRNEAALLLSVWLTEIISIYMYIPRVFIAFNLYITFMSFTKCKTLLTRFLGERNHFPGALQQHLLFEESFWRNHILFIDHPSPLHTSPIFGPY